MDWLGVSVVVTCVDVTASGAADGDCCIAVVPSSNVCSDCVVDVEALRMDCCVDPA